MNYASEEEQRKCRTPEGKLLRFAVEWNAYPSFCLQPKMILAYPPPIYTASKKQPFPQKASTQTQTWGSIIDLTLHTKDAPVLLLVRLVPRAGASKNLQLAVYQRRCPSWVLFPNPALLPLMGLVPIPRLGPFQSTWSLQYVFQQNHVISFIQEGKKKFFFFFFECLYVWQCAELVKGFLIQGIRSPRCQDSPLRPSKASAGGAGSLPTSSSQPGRSRWPPAG